MNPEDLTDTIYVVRSGPDDDSFEMFIRKDHNCLLLGLPLPEEDAPKWEKTLRDYVRYLILKAINMDREPEEPADPTTAPPR